LDSAEFVKRASSELLLNIVLFFNFQQIGSFASKAVYFLNTKLPISFSVFYHD